MKFFGDVDVGENSIFNVVINDDGSFQSTPKIGRLVFNSRRLYICADIINGLPIWVPLTNEITTHVTNIEVPSTTWTLTHNLNTATPAVQIYDATQRAVIPDDIIITDNNNVEVHFANAVSGMAVCVFGNTEGVNHLRNSYSAAITTPTVEANVQHNLGYNPTVVVYDGTGTMIIPSSITHNSLFSTTIAFTDPMTGTIRFT